MRINVTADDIANGVHKDCERCPVALAVKRATGCVNCDVTADTIYATGMPVFTTPRSVQEFIARFDREYPVQPFSFYLKGLKT